MGSTIMACGSKAFVTFLILSWSTKGHADIACRNDDGQPVDWFIAYKLPGRAKGNLKGLQYLYMDPSTNGWTTGKYLINDTRNAVAQTLLPLYKNPTYENEDFGYLVYNDQPPRNMSITGHRETEEELPVSASYGHSKGVILLDTKTGIWLIHSTPKFPAQKNYTWPSNAVRNGQSFICVTYPYDQFKDIGEQLRYIHPYCYYCSLPETYPASLQCAASAGCYPNYPPWQRQVSLMTVGQNKFVSFAKYSRFGDDLYSGWLANALRDNLLVESWVKVRGRLPTNCSMKYHVYNVKEIQIHKDIKFKSTTDHSKWCITEGQEKWTCIGGLNRNKKASRRGGGVICTDNSLVWKIFQSSVKVKEPCP
ncbi:deoxyribonuclease-2-alpha-like [Protopterus annectens]|uniref:deoxyribonuclease-2-alpha-like n=1 Tax=Protopterus annectens TaxID=7888 RepID=UPI001CFA4B21|nr:deoxyribonuclease-2-alpha-like [Protopterus annectens]